ncbi:hypothetical protein TNCV_5051481 [Trichonephila clavipes]|nr:hypothetical protein TNCV_5051481 [Trichonephila clavipes]
MSAFSISGASNFLNFSDNNCTSSLQKIAAKTKKKIFRGKPNRGLESLKSEREARRLTRIVCCNRGVVTNTPTNRSATEFRVTANQKCTLCEMLLKQMTGSIASDQQDSFDFGQTKIMWLSG